VLIQTPSGAQILVDGGSFPSRLLTNIGDRIPFYDRNLELLVISQPDEADTSALTAVLQRYEASVVLINGQANLSESYAALESVIARSEVTRVQAGYTINFSDGTVIEILHPQNPPDISDNLNDGVLVLRVTYGEFSFLLPSDLSYEGQHALLASGQWPLADVMQIPQHGTARSLSEEFLAAVQPQVLILQSDKTNRRGDPDSEVLNLLGETTIFRTDAGGTRHLWTDGRTLWTED
jgi:competence protein ComEC